MPGIEPIGVGVQVFNVCRASFVTGGEPCCSTRWAENSFSEFRCEECRALHQPSWGKLVQYTSTTFGRKMSTFYTTTTDDSVRPWQAAECPVSHLPPREQRAAWLQGLPSRADGVQNGLVWDALFITTNDP